MSGKSQSASSSQQLQDFYTVKDLSKRWRVSERHVRRLIDAGKVKVTRIENAIRISAANVALYEAMQGL
jgi:excisionase family DNA binding protein